MKFAKQCGKLVAAVMLAALLGTQSLFAQSYPSKPVRMIVPYPPGVASDFLTYSRCATEIRSRAVYRSILLIYKL
jgi:tripartite-type tricarboxylate transporter receptor subunit TctC